MPGLAQSVLNYGRKTAGSAGALGASHLYAMLARPTHHLGSWGAAAGAVYGGISSDTSVIGGALGGMAIGRYGGGMANFAVRAGLNPRANISGFGSLMKRSARVGMMRMYRDGARSSFRIGKTAGRAVNFIKGLKR